MHPCTDFDELSAKLKLYGHQVKRIENITNRDALLPLFLIELEPRETNINIYKITALMHVAFEPPRKMLKVPQSTRCQYFSHNKY